MANLTKSLVMPNGQEYEFIGKTWYGVCSTGSSTQIKQVTINGFTASDLVNGTKVVVQFLAGQTYNGIPKLNINNIGARFIYDTGGEFAQQYEWNQGQIISFIYDSGAPAWIIEDGAHATTQYWGKTKLASSDSWNYSEPSINNAATPATVRDLAQKIQRDSCTYLGESIPYQTITVTASQWSIDEDYASCSISGDFTNIFNCLNGNQDSMKTVKVTFGSTYGLYTIPLYSGTQYFIEVYINTVYGSTTIYIEDDHIFIDTQSELAIETLLKIEVFVGVASTGIITKQYLETYMNTRGYLTPADLPNIPTVESTTNVAAMLTSFGLNATANLAPAAAGSAETDHAVVQ